MLTTIPGEAFMDEAFPTHLKLMFIWNEETSYDKLPKPMNPTITPNILFAVMFMKACTWLMDREQVPYDYPTINPGPSFPPDICIDEVILDEFSIIRLYQSSPTSIAV